MTDKRFFKFSYFYFLFFLFLVIAWNFSDFNGGVLLPVPIGLTQVFGKRVEPLYYFFHSF